MELGTWEKIPLREIWAREDTNFTPWLEQHLPELQRAIHALAPITITDTQTEVSTEDVRCDILGNVGEEKIIIENMLEKSDFEHLGKCITYASKHKAKHIVWVAEEFKEEHLSAIDWLNENFNLDSEINFYAVEVSVIQIKKDGTVSVAAPDFVAVRQPEIEIKQKREEAEDREISARYVNRKQFWADFIDAYSQINPKWKGKVSTFDNWKSTSSGISGASFNVSFMGRSRNSSPTVGLWIQTPDVKINQKIFDGIITHKESIEQRWNSVSNNELEWKSPNLGNLTENQKYRDIRVTADFTIDFKNSSEEENKKCKDWLVENLKNFEEVFTPIINGLKS